MGNPRSEPGSICILRLSALGDVTHVVPLVRNLQDALPGCRITWIVGRLEARLVGDVPGVDFVAVDKNRGIRAWLDLERALAGRRFEALLHCQVAFRANLLATAVRADRRIGYDADRAKDLHGLVIRERIAPGRGQHVLEAIGSFAQPLGVAPRPPRWDIPVPDEARAFAEHVLPGEQSTLIVAPCSSHALRNWLPERYAAIADHAIARHGLRVALCGGPGVEERRMGDAILSHMRAREQVTDLIGKDTLKRYLALAQRAALVLSPDSGPMHMANAVGTPVLGLHAASNPARSGAYSSRAWAVDRYDAAARRYRGVPAERLPWGTKLEYPGVMELVETEAVAERLDRFLAGRAAR
jgi:heptosyltransferase I